MKKSTVSTLEMIKYRGRGGGFFCICPSSSRFVNPLFLEWQNVFQCFRYLYVLRTVFLTKATADTIGGFPFVINGPIIVHIR